MRRALLGVFTYVGFALVLVAWLPVLGMVALLDRGNLRRRGRWMRRFGRVSARVAPQWRFRIEGTPPADVDRRAYVVVANHQSTADPWLLSGLRWDMRWIAKASLFRAPVIGWLMKLGGDLPVVRGQGASVRAMLAEADATLAGGLSLMIFPEGTRSPDGELGRFKDGAFELAIGRGAPILPVVVHGTHRCRPKGSWWFGEAEAVAKVLPPIPTVGLTLADVPALREQVRARIAVELERLRKAPVRVIAPAPVTSGELALPAVMAAAVLTAASPGAGPGGDDAPIGSAVGPGDAIGVREG
ncbi:MAG: 1-acyl-sn-glycerol-3-phosphate acyltransferase [Kofleriaceae bacterium]|nr:1-acyl-sn-glycerol-3-phosphate acyltransferase [Kofleriaceae bacterium]MBP9167905.1 1-acyl-sn-glycerol-3-phosphate acyltransferase [Kofleriaceae bacterium]MBP9856739.1 1-acyl-sn-glycerol-3-phosphate acyltransferase [Kofleriaceae bacterium]